MPLAVQSQSTPAATFSAGPATKGLEDYGLLIYDRYMSIFEPVDPVTLPEDCVRLGAEDVLFLIEAPLNAVELYEAILKPRQPLTVHKARLVPRRTKMSDRHKALVDEYLGGQGKLAGRGSEGGNAVDREVSFAVLPRDTIWQLQMFYHFIWPVQLQYMSIPVRVSGAKTVRSPYALLSYNGHRVYQKKLKTLLKDMKLADSSLSRSLLRPGTSPLPETLRDYMDGEPGKTAAMPYLEKSKDGTTVPEQRPTTMLRRVASNIPLRRAVSRVTLRRTNSVSSIAAQRE